MNVVSVSISYGFDFIFHMNLYAPCGEYQQMNILLQTLWYIMLWKLLRLTIKKMFYVSEHAYSIFSGVIRFASGLRSYLIMIPRKLSQSAVTLYRAN